MTQELSKKKKNRQVSYRIACFHTACAGGGELQWRVRNFYLQTFGSALSWWKPSVPSFISCIELSAKNGFSRLCAGFLRSKAMLSSALGLEDPVPSGEQPRRWRWALLWFTLWKEPCTHSCSFARSPELDTCWMQKSQTGGKCHFNCTGSCGFEPE